MEEHPLIRLARLQERSKDAGPLVAKLVKAARAGNLSSVKRLLAQGVDPNLADLNDPGADTPVWAAMYARKPEVIEVLGKAGADLNDGMESPLRVAVFWGDLKLIRALAAGGADLNRPSHEDTPLCYAIRRSQVEAAVELIRLGADVKLPSPAHDGRTPAELAQELGSKRVLAAVSAAGADVPSKPAKQSKRNAMKKRPKPQPPSPATFRGVETFDTNDTVLLVRADVEPVADAFAKLKKAKLHRQSVLGKSVTVRDPSYMVLRLAGHAWTLITPCARSQSSFFKSADAKALSKSLKTRAIYFANSDTASFTEYELFEAGKPLEHFRCFEDIEFTTKLRKVKPPPDGPEIYTFVDRFIKEQDAFVPALSVHLNAGWMNVGEKATLGPQEELPKSAFERLDFIA
jgi:hypothetical protein